MVVSSRLTGTTALGVALALSTEHALRERPVLRSIAGAVAVMVSCGSAGPEDTDTLAPPWSTPVHTLAGEEGVALSSPHWQREAVLR